MARLNQVASFRGTTKTEDGNLRCSKCGKTITPGMPYQWWANKLPRARGSVRRIRCMDCTPSRADMTPGRRGELMRAQESFDNQLAEATTFDDLRSVRDDIAQQLHDLASELTDGADNMEQGFGHETYQSQELRERGETLDEVADRMEYTEPDNEPEEDDEDQDEQALENALDAYREAISEIMYEAEV